MMKAQMKGISLMIILLMLVLTVQAAALRGTVTDKATKEPLIGAAVQLSGTNTGTITDVDGNFELAGLRNGTYKLIISYVSYCTQTVEVTINGMFEIKVELEQDNQQLGEVVVVADEKRIRRMLLLPNNVLAWLCKREFLPSRLPRRKIKMLRK